MTIKKQLLLLAVAAFVFDAVFTEKPFWASKYIWDVPADPRLVGQVVQFTEPMGYILIREDSDRKPTKEEVVIGKKLILENDFEDLYKRYGYKDEEFSTIRTNMQFTIIKVGWFRKDLYSQQLVGDYKVVVLRDENDIESIALFSTFYDSNRPDFYELRNKGEFSD